MLEDHNSVFYLYCKDTKIKCVWVFVKVWGADESVYKKYKRVYRSGNNVTSKWSIIMSDIYLQKKTNKDNLQKSNYFFTSLIE